MHHAKNNQSFFFTKYAPAVFFNCSSIVITGFQPSSSRALGLSTRNEANKRLATSQSSLLLEMIG